MKLKDSHGICVPVGGPQLTYLLAIRTDCWPPACTGTPRLFWSGSRASRPQTTAPDWWSTSRVLCSLPGGPLVCPWSVGPSPRVLLPASVGAVHYLPLVKISHAVDLWKNKSYNKANSHSGTSSCHRTQWQRLDTVKLPSWRQLWG